MVVIELHVTCSSIISSIGEEWTLATAEARGKPAAGAQRAKFAKKVYKPPLLIIAIKFELDGFNAWVPWSPSDTKKL